MKKRNCLIRLTPLLPVLALASGALVLFGVSLFPFEMLKPGVDALASGGVVERFTVQFYMQVTLRLKLLASALVVAALIAYFARGKIAGSMDGFYGDLRDFTRETGAYLKRVFVGEEKIFITALSIIFVLAAAVRLYFLFQPVRYDEAATFLYFASRPWYVGISDYGSPNNHLFHTFLVHLVYRTIGFQPWAIRLPAFFSGLLMVPAAFLAARLLYNRYAALFAAGLVAAASYLIEFSTLARGYTMVGLAFLMLLSLSAYLRRRGNSFAWQLFAALAALGFFTIPVMLYPFGVVAMWLFISIVSENKGPERGLLLKRLFVSLTITAALTLLLYAPALVVSGWEAVLQNRIVAPQGWNVFVAQLPGSLFSIWDQWSRDILPFIGALLIAGFGVSLVFHRRVANHAVPLIAAAAAFLLPVLIIHQIVPFVRVWLFMLALGLIVAAAGLGYLFKYLDDRSGKRKTIIASVAALALTALLSFNVAGAGTLRYSNETGTLREAESITLLLKDILREGDRVVAAAPSDGPLEYYFKLYGLPPGCIWADPSSAGRLIVVVNDAFAHSLPDLLRNTGLPAHTLGLPELLERYESATVYQVSIER